MPGLSKSITVNSAPPIVGIPNNVPLPTIPESRILTVSNSDLLQIALRQYQVGYYTQAEDHCMRLRRDDRNNTDILLLLACINFECGRLQKCEEWSNLAIQQNPRLAEAYSNLGNVHMERGQQHLALKYYRRAIQLKPSFINAYINLAIALVAVGDMEQAVQPYVTALQYNSELYYVRNDLGNILRSLGKTQEAKR